MVRYRNNAFDRALCGLIVALILVGLASLILYAAYALMAIALRENAPLTVMALSSLAVGLVLTSRLSGQGPRPAADDPPGEDSGGDDGGQRRRRPRAPDEPPTGGDPAPGPGLDWDEFDAARRDWERVPALVG